DVRPGPLDAPRGDLAGAARVVLLPGLRLKRAALGGHQHALERPVGNGDRAAAEDPRLVERLPRRVVLLTVGVARARVAGHDDSGLRAVDAGLPRVARLDQAAVVSLARQLTHVPDVAVA